MNPDFRDMLSEFINHQVEFMVVGGYAMAAHDLPRATGDIDLWVKCDADNAMRIWKALEAFGAPLHLFSRDDLAKPGMVVQLGIPPNRIDIVTQIEGVDFDHAWPNHTTFSYGMLTVPVIGLRDLISNKQATGREKDKLDARRLRRKSSDAE